MAEEKKVTSTTKKSTTTKKPSTATTAKKATTTKTTTVKKPTTANKTTVAKSTTAKSTTPKKEILVSIKGLETAFKDKGSTKVVHACLDLDIYDGEVLSIIGANGAGKTVLVETITGIRNVQKGTITVKEDFDIQLESGLQFQTEDNASELIKPRNIITFYKKFYKGMVDEAELENMIKVFGLEEFLDRKINKLSGGQKQRLNLLLACMHQPKLLILDEFTTGLDITSVIDILDYIVEMVKKNKSTLIVITHSAKEIKMLADRVVLINNGVIANEITTTEIETKYKGDFDQFMIDQIRGSK